MVGTNLAHYEIRARIGTGGMGEVYRAYDTRLEREVAIKTLRPDLEIPGGRSRFRREALALSRLNHPVIATIHDTGSQEGLDYLVMEFVEGETLGERLRSGPLSRAEILRLSVQLAEGLQVAHEHDLLHRDLKPANLMITPDGRLKILDFGLAKHSAPTSDTEATRSQTQTLTQGPVGTLPYMAPEQLRNEEPDPRTDLYAVGAVLYEMSTGLRPHGNKTAAELAAAILSEQPQPPSQVQATVDPDLETVILKSLQKDRQQRYQTAHDLLADLQRLVAGLEAQQRVEQRRRRRRRVLIGAIPIAIVAALLALNVGHIRQHILDLIGAGPPVIRSLAVLPLVNRTGDPEQEVFADGMTEDLITSLQKIQAMERVVSPRSVMRFKNSELDPSTIAKDLGVDAIVEGSYLRSGEQVKVNLRLIHAGPNIDLWADSFQRSLRDILALHGELAVAIAEQIQVALSPNEKRLLATDREVDAEAYREYLLGRSQFWIGTARAFRSALPHFAAAIAIDSTYVQAHAAHATAYAWLVAENGVVDTTGFGPARRMARRALELDPLSAESHTAMANVHFWLDLNVGAAEREFQRALELDPTDPWTRYLASFFWYFIGQDEKAIQEAERAFRQAPLDPVASRNLGWLYYATGQHEKAIAQHEQTLRLPEQFLGEGERRWAHTQIGWNLIHLGRWDDLMAKVERGEYALSLGDSCLISITRGDSSVAREAVAQGRLGSGESEWNAWGAAQLGDPEPYFAKIEQFYEQKSCRLYWNIRGPEMPAVVRDDPRHGQWLERLGLAR